MPIQADANVDLLVLKAVDRLGGAGVGDEQYARLPIETDDADAGADPLHEAIECRLSGEATARSGPAAGAVPPLTLAVSIFDRRHDRRNHC
jgi:hypothetical protein